MQTSESGVFRPAIMEPCLRAMLATGDAFEVEVEFDGGMRSGGISEVGVLGFRIGGSGALVESEVIYWHAIRALTIRCLA